MVKKSFIVIFLLFSVIISMGGSVFEKYGRKAEKELIKKYGNEEKDRIERGISQVLKLWRKEDGDGRAPYEFLIKNYVPKEKLDPLYNRFSENLEEIIGRFHQIRRKLLEPIELTYTNIMPVDYMFGEYNPYTHFSEDMFKSKIAFVALLNFPVYSLEEKLNVKKVWSRRDWAYERLAEVFSSRVPSKIEQEITKAYLSAGDYINNYNIFTGHLIDKNGKKIFKENKKLISHWGLRDEIKALYSEKNSLKKQRTLYNVMIRIINQTIPEKVINNDRDNYLWEPSKNILYIGEKRVKFNPENNKRYEYLIEVFKAEKKAAPYYIGAKNFIERRFNLDREIPEKEVEKILISVISSPVAKRVGKFIEKRLARKLEPFDIWYDGFKERGKLNEKELDRIVRKKYPDINSFQKNIKQILLKLDFPEKEAQFISKKITVDPSRGAGHALGAEMREDNAHLRTRFTKDGLNYKGYNIAIHELGHCVEQVISLNMIDYYTLRGVPNTAFTEAFAFLFQARDLELLGIRKESKESQDLKVLDTFWNTYEIAGVSLVDMRVWRYMYEHPDLKPEELKNIVISIAKDVWNKYYADVFGIKDSPILAIYSHMIDAGLYLPDYPIGFLIQFQIENYIKGKKLGIEMLRMVKNGNILPALWMEEALGSGISAEPLLRETDKALKKFGF